MKRAVPTWALHRAGLGAHSLARAAHDRGTLQIRWPDVQALRGWAKQQGWPVPWLGFEAAFITRLLENEANFELGLRASGVEIFVPKPEHTLAPDEVGVLDALYAERSDSGRPTGWGSLVEALREMRRAVEAGVVLRIEGAPAITTWQAFYEWAHGRYHMLEDGYDHWIGDDAS